MSDDEPRRRNPRPAPRSASGSADASRPVVASPEQEQRRARGEQPPPAPPAGAPRRSGRSVVDESAPPARRRRPDGAARGTGEAGSRSRRTVASSATPPSSDVDRDELARRRAAADERRRAAAIEQATAAVAAVAERDFAPAAGSVLVADRVAPSAPMELPPFVDGDDGWVRLPRRTSWVRRSLTLLSVVAVLGLLAAGLTWRWVQRQIDPTGEEGAAVELTIETGDTTNNVASKLVEKDVIGNATVFRYWVRDKNPSGFKAGVYDLRENMSFDRVLATLNGPAKAGVTLRVTIPPGLTSAQIREKILQQLPNFNAAELDAAIASPEVNLKYAPTGKLLNLREGTLFPDTYNLDDRTSADELALLVRMRDEMQRVLDDLDVEQRARELRVTPWDVLVVASLVEREAKVDGDRAKIARVIYNRLDRRMKLQIDATVLYAVGKIGDKIGPITLSDLAFDSPYNTYVVNGLPPTPIAAPSRKSIEAALAPADGKWLWYVLTDKSGAHTFAENERDFLVARDICFREKLC